MTVTLAWMGIWSTALLAIGMLHTPLVRRRSVKLLLFPGMIVDGVLRTIGCLASATPIERVSPLSGERPLLEQSKSFLGPLGACIAALVRCSLLMVAAFLLLTYFPEFMDSGFALPLIDEDTIETGILAWHSFPDFWEQVQALPAQLSFRSISGALLLYTLIATLVFAGIKKQEFFWLACTWCAALFLGFAAAWLGIKFGFFSRGWFIQILYVPQMWSAFSLVVLATIVVAAILGLIRGVPLLFKPLNARRDRGR